ncbi:cytochrome P450 [Streptomyces sp. NPDC059224]|uniref:cytochrome P450 n=1 Tax=Streptomyces sp. NPDC059224 TaxID=3346775 RepID=UPI0036CC8DAC
MKTSVSPRSFDDIDLFSDALLDDPYPAYASLRDEASAVWLPTTGVWAIPRYREVREILGDWERFTSAEGVGFNDDVNAAMAGTVLASDPPLHDTLRGVLAERLSPRALRKLSVDIRSQADALVDRLVRRGSFDAVGDLAQVFPPSIVADLIGIPHDVRPRLLPWGDGWFNAMGPRNARMADAFPLVNEQFGWLHSVQGTDLLEGSMGRAIFEAADAGLIERASAPILLAAYTSAAMDTTVNAIGSAVWLFTRFPEQWDLLRADASLIPAAFNEVLRLESPVQSFTRVTRQPVEFDGVQVPAGARVVVMYGSANRDERHYGDTAGTFDITRDAADHLAFGYGLHGCAGQGLARLEAHAVLASLAERVTRFIPAGEPTRHLNNTVRGLAEMNITVETI